ncbi:GNAT family N-acetyltransferase [Streptomyces sp. NPDC049040]|uniref:GNAT family N-acetyltransferase n=1 Tax=Streptomyces sp. NPDC049040 TaxID=3365593 RepID=UPI0037116234
MRRWQVAVAGPADAAALRELFAACSQDTVRLRFFGQVRALPPDYLEHVLAGRADVHDAVVAYEYGAGRARLAGLASLALPPGARAAEIGVLVGDAWQRQGAGRAMVDLLLSRARARGVRYVSAAVLPGRSGLLAALGRRLPAERLAHSADGPSGVYKLDGP